LANKDFETLRGIILPFINDIRAESRREEKDDLFQKHYWSVFKRKPENSHIKDLWKALPRSNAKISPAKISNVPTLSPSTQSTVDTGSELPPNLLAQSPPEAFDNFVEDFRDEPEGFYPGNLIQREEPLNCMNELIEETHFLSTNDEEIPDSETVVPQSKVPFYEEPEAEIPAYLPEFLRGIKLPKKEEPKDLDFENMSFENESQEYEDPFDRLTAHYLRLQEKLYI